MVVGILQVELTLHGVHSLKEKRGSVRRILGRCRERFPVSAAEVDDHDIWQSSVLGFSMVSVDEASIDRVFHKVEEHIEGLGLAEISGFQKEYLHY